MSDSEEKTRPASDRKLMKQREEGSIAQATEGAAFLGAAACLLLMAAGFVTALSLIRAMFLSAFGSIGMSFQHGLGTVLADVARTGFAMVVPIVATMLAFTLTVTLIYNRGPAFAAKPVTLQFNRVSMKAGVKRIYGRRGWIETGTGALRVSVFFAVMILVTWLFLPQIVSVPRCGFPCTARLAIWLVSMFLTTAILIFVVASAIDMIVQRSIFLHEQKMTESESKRETKEQLGDPEIRKERRRQQRDGVKQADAIGPDRANMCFFAGDVCFAIRYHPQYAPMPRIAAVSKKPAGRDALRDRVRANGFPELEDDVLVGLLTGSVPGDAVPERAFDRLAMSMGLIFKKN